MGQAKNRGNREDRIAQAKARMEANKPASLKCNNCENQITEITALDTKGMAGIRAAFAGICPNCSQTTWAIDGDPEAVADALVFLKEGMGAEGKMGYEMKAKT